MMRLFISAFLLLLLACTNNNNDDQLLTEQPYDKLTDSIRLQPGNADLYYRRGVMLFQNNHIGYAKNDIAKAWQLSPQEDYALSLATIHRQKNVDSAIIFLQNAIQQLPSSIALKISLARGYQKKNDLDRALQILNDILLEYPTQIDALILRAEILKQSGKEAEALAALESAYNYAPFDVELTYNLAMEYATSGNRRALLIADSLIRMDITGVHAEPYYFKGVYYVNTGNIAEALKQLNDAISHDYYFLDAHMEKGELLYNQKRYNEALKTFQLAATVSPTFADAYFWIGKTQEAMGNKPEAKLNYLRAYGLDKSLTEARDAANKI